MITKYNIWIAMALKDLATACYSVLHCNDASNFISDHAQSAMCTHSSQFTPIERCYINLVL